MLPVAYFQPEIITCWSHSYWWQPLFYSAFLLQCGFQYHCSLWQARSLGFRLNKETKRFTVHTDAKFDFAQTLTLPGILCLKMVMLKLSKPLQQMLHIPTNPLEGCCLTFSPPFLLLAGFSKSRTYRKHNYHWLLKTRRQNDCIVLTQKSSLRVVPCNTTFMQPLFLWEEAKTWPRLVSNRGGLGTSLYLLGFVYHYTTHIVRKSTLNKIINLGILLGQQQTTPDLPLVEEKKMVHFLDKIECMCAWVSLTENVTMDADVVAVINI